MKIFRAAGAEIYFERKSNFRIYFLFILILLVIGTSTPSEQVFSTTGLIINTKRKMLSPQNVGQIQVIHHNENLLKRSEFLFIGVFIELIVYKYLLMLI